MTLIFSGYFTRDCNYTYPTHLYYIIYNQVSTWYIYYFQCYSFNLFYFVFIAHSVCLCLCVCVRNWIHYVPRVFSRAFICVLNDLQYGKILQIHTQVYYANSSIRPHAIYSALIVNGEGSGGGDVVAGVVIDELGCTQYVRALELWNSIWLNGPDLINWLSANEMI